MTLRMAHIASRMFNTPLMIDAGKAAAILAGIGARVHDGGFILPPDLTAIDHTAFERGRPSEQMGLLGDRLGRAYENAGAGERMFDRIGKLAVIPIEGTLVHKGGFLGTSSGEMSYEGLQTRVRRVSRAHDEGAIRGAVFEIDTYGGEVAGVFDTMHMIADLSKKMPTIAILTDFAYSAGYLMASAARQIVIPETGGAGSIGVISMHADFSKKLENDGIKVTLVSSGATKGAGHPAFPLDEATAKRMQANNDRTRDLFAEAVGRNRGKRLTKEAALATEALSYRGQDAVDAGLVDFVERPSVAFEAFLSAVNRAA